MRRFLQWLFRIYPDQFRLDVARVIQIDGHEFVIEGWTASESYTNTHEISVAFKRWQEPEKEIRWSWGNVGRPTYRNIPRG